MDYFTLGTRMDDQRITSCLWIILGKSGYILRFFTNDNSSHPVTFRRWIGCGRCWATVQVHSLPTGNPHSGGLERVRSDQRQTHSDYLIRYIMRLFFCVFFISVKIMSFWCLVIVKSSQSDYKTHMPKSNFAALAISWFAPCIGDVVDVICPVSKMASGTPKSPIV